MGLFITRYCSSKAQMQYMTKKYANEMSNDIDLQQTLNTLSKIETMAVVTRDRIISGEETLQELEEDYQRMDKLRNVRRVVLANGGIVEIILRNFDYYPNHMAATRAALSALTTLVPSDVALKLMMDKSIAEEKEMDRRIAGVQVKEVEFTRRVEKKRGLGVLNSMIKQILPEEEKQSNSEHNKYLRDTEAALKFVIEAELTPRLPLKFARVAALFHDDEVMQEYLEDISDAIRGIHSPIKRISDIIEQSQTYYKFKYPERKREEKQEFIGIDSGVISGNTSGNMGGHNSNKSNEEDTPISHTSIKKAKLNKYRVDGSSTCSSNSSNNQKSTVRKGKRKLKSGKVPFPFVKGDRIEAQLQTYWRKRYAGIIIRARRKGPGFLYTVKFDDGEIAKRLSARNLHVPALHQLDPEESLRSLLRIANYPRWQTRPDLQTLCIRAIKLVLDCGDDRANSRMFVMLGGVNILMSAMNLFPNSARLNIRACQLLCCVILGPTRTFGAKYVDKDESNKVPQTDENHVDEFDIDADKERQEENARIIEIESRCAKAFGAAGAIRLLTNLMRVDFIDERLNTTVRKQGVWALHCLAVNRNNVKIMESCGGMYVLQLAAQDPMIVISRRLKLVEWKTLRETRLAGGIDDEMEKIKFLNDLFVDCIHTTAGLLCQTPHHCKQCFVNKHASGFWHKIGCKAHPGNTDVPSLLKMEQMRYAKDRHWANQGLKKQKQQASDNHVQGDDDTNAKMLGLDAKNANREIPEEWLS